MVYLLVGRTAIGWQYHLDCHDAKPASWQLMATLDAFSVSNSLRGTTLCTTQHFFHHLAIADRVTCHVRLRNRRLRSPGNETHHDCFRRKHTVRSTFKFDVTLSPDRKVRTKPTYTNHVRPTSARLLVCSFESLKKNCVILSLRVIIHPRSQKLFMLAVSDTLSNRAKIS